MAFSVGACEARVAELADAPDLGSGGQPWGFESPLSHSSAVEAYESSLVRLAHHSLSAVVERARGEHTAGQREGVRA